MAMNSPQASPTLEQEDMSNREDVNPSTGGQVDSATGEHVDTSTVTGDPFYCGERKLGTWFCERPKAKPSEPRQPRLGIADLPPAARQDRCAA
jgi:conjugal transfer pilus assembly protein TraF